MQRYASKKASREFKASDLFFRQILSLELVCYNKIVPVHPSSRHVMHLRNKIH